MRKIDCKDIIKHMLFNINNLNIDNIVRKNKIWKMHLNL